MRRLILVLVVAVAAVVLPASAASAGLPPRPPVVSTTPTGWHWTTASHVCPPEYGGVVCIDYPTRLVRDPAPPHAAAPVTRRPLAVAPARGAVAPASWLGLAVASARGAVR